VAHLKARLEAKKVLADQRLGAGTRHCTFQKGESGNPGDKTATGKTQARPPKVAWDGGGGNGGGRGGFQAGPLRGERPPAQIKNQPAEIPREVPGRS